MRTLLRTAGLVALPLAAGLLAAPSATAAAGATAAPGRSTAGTARPGAAATLLAGPAATGASAVGVDDAAAAGTGTGTGTVTTASATFTVTYHGFSPAAKAAFARAVTTWGAAVSSPVPITVDATFERLGPGVLGSAGAGTFVRDFPRAPRAGTWYPEALVNKHLGRQFDSGTPDIVASFSSAFTNWWFGTGAAPVGKYDFQTVVTHELGHGLGFLGFGRLDSSSTGSVRLAGFPSAYDRATENAAGKALLTFADPSSALKTQLTSGKVFFDSPAVRSAHGGTPVKLYAPSSFQPGSSYSHLDEATFRKGTVDSLMTPQLSDGETVRTAGPITKAVFSTIGW